MSADPPASVGPDVLVLGEIMRVLVAEPGDAVSRAERFRSTVGGAEGNVAIGLSRLGLSTSWVGKVGDDDAGRYVLRRMRAEAVGVQQVDVVHGSFTGLLIRNSSPDGAISVNYHRAGSAGSQLDGQFVTRALAAGAPKVVHVSGITAMLSPTAAGAVRELMLAAKAAGALVSFDVNLRTRIAPLEAWREAIPELAAQADIVFAGGAEIALIADGEPVSVAKALCADHAKVVVLKNADHSCSAVTADAVVNQPPLARRVVDPVGAGDGLVAGFLSGWLSSASPAESLRRGAGVAAFAVGTWSDTEDYPDEPELQGFLESLNGNIEQVVR